MTTSDNHSAPLTLTLFGPMQVSIQGEPLPPLRSRKALWLLALLALRPQRPVQREWLAGTLWPDVDQSQSFANLRVVLSELRRALGSERERLRSPDRHTLILDLTGAEVDLRTFDAAMESKQLSALEQAVALYRGPLLEGCSEEWVPQERRVREQACVQALQMLAEAAQAVADYTRAAGYYQQAVRIDPWCEAAQRGWMEALAKGGDHNAALQVYRKFVQLLKDDPSAAPDEKTTTLYVHLRAEARQQADVRAVVATPAATTPVVSGYLPHPPTELVGREDERLEVAARLRRARLVTLAGIGGIGKTRLATEVAKEVVREYADGVWLVALETLADGQLVTTHIASVLGLREARGWPLLSGLTDHLRQKRLLLVLDNCEHLLEASAEVAAHLLQECPEIRILATSREPLGITGEAVWSVPALAMPDPIHLPQAHDTLLRMAMSYESVQLFVERAQAIQKTFALSGSNARTVAQICFQLEGIPLAIELAASRINTLTLEQIAARLDNELGLLVGSSRTAWSRQQTLRTTLDWSYALLSDPERVLLRRLSVFVGGWTLEAAEQVCAEGVLDLLISLVDKSLVVFETREGQPEGRYRLLEMVRQYAAERLQASGEREQIQGRRRDYFLALVEEAELQLKGAEQAVWLARLEAERENLRAVLASSGTEEDRAEVGLRLAGALWRYWEVRGQYSEGRAYLAEALARTGSHKRTKRRAQVLNWAGVLAGYQGDEDDARALHEESLAIARELGDWQAMAWPLDHLGLLARLRGDYEAARELHEESLEIWRALGDRGGIGWSLHQLGNLMREQGEYAKARALYAESLAISRQLADKRGIAWSLNDLGKLASDQGDYETARRMHEESLAIDQELGDRQGAAWSQQHLAIVYGAGRDYATAQAMFEESLETFRASGVKQGIAWTVHHLAGVMAALGDYPAARSLQEESLAIQREQRNQVGIAWSLNGL